MSASIRPRLLCRGNVLRSISACRVRRMLQFGRGCYAAETRLSAPVSAQRSRFNSAAAVMPRKRSHEPSRNGFGVSLQFGRGCYAAETGRAASARTGAGELQFGRGCYAAETADSASPNTSRLASIRPRLLCRGNDVRFYREFRRTMASIRPRLLCRGNEGRSRTPVDIRRFNSAAAVMPRKRGEMDAIVPDEAAGFNSAAAVMPRKPPSLRARSRRELIAASIRPRLLCRGNSARGLCLIARSVLQFGRGCYAAETRSPAPTAPPTTSFNSAAAVMPRKQEFRRAAWHARILALQFGRGCYAAETRSTQNRAKSSKWLQFGRGCYAAETWQPCLPGCLPDGASIRPRLLCRGNGPRRRRLPVPTDASIRPRLLCRGNSVSPRGTPPAARGFNSAAAVMPRKPWFLRWVRCLQCGLQFGRGCYAAETRTAPSPVFSGLRASIRPRLLCRGNRAAARGDGRETVCFNSAAAVMPRKPARRYGATVRFCEASIRPRLLCRGNGQETYLKHWCRQLQFGRGCYAAETGVGVRERANLEPLQFGRGCYAAETARKSLPSAGSAVLQFGRGCYAAETRGYAAG